MRSEGSVTSFLVAAIIIVAAAGAPVATYAQPGGAQATGECTGSTRLVIVIDDVVNVAAPVAELARRAQLAPVSQALQAALTPNPCLELLDNDPLFWTLPGAMQPEVILRVRLSELTVAEQSIGDKAGNAVGRYLGSYLGSHTEDVPLFKQVAIAVDVLCPRTRKKVTTISGQSMEPQPPAPEQNSLRLQSAGQMAAQEITSFFAVNPQVCANTSSNSIPAVVSGMN